MQLVPRWLRRYQWTKAATPLQLLCRSVGASSSKFGSMYSGLMSDPYAHDAGPGVSWGKEKEHARVKEKQQQRKKKVLEMWRTQIEN